MNRIDLTPLYRSSVGFDRFESLLDAAFQTEKTSAGYPPYNIEALEGDHYAITVSRLPVSLKMSSTCRSKKAS